MPLKQWANGGKKANHTDIDGGGEHAMTTNGNYSNESQDTTNQRERMRMSEREDKKTGTRLVLIKCNTYKHSSRQTHTHNCRMQ